MSPITKPFSVLIIVKGRQDHLLNVLRAIELSEAKPSEVVIVHMNETAYPLPANTFQVYEYELSDNHPLPLARARNLAAAHARSDNLVFLDVDCIPAPDCFTILLGDTADGRLTMADPRYLPAATERIDFAEFEGLAQASPHRSKLRFGSSKQYELFWSLGFSLTRAGFEQLGGFDDRYIGYGAEDTDLAFHARAIGMDMYYSRARIYHQYHDNFEPPLNWLADIVTNAAIFKAKWGVWPMEGWLGAFRDSGFIDWQDDTVTIRTMPTSAQIAGSRKQTAVTN